MYHHMKHSGPDFRLWRVSGTWRALPAGCHEGSSAAAWSGPADPPGGGWWLVDGWLMESERCLMVLNGCLMINGKLIVDGWWFMVDTLLMVNGWWMVSGWLVTIRCFHVVNQCFNRTSPMAAEWDGLLWSVPWLLLEELPVSTCHVGSWGSRRSTPVTWLREMCAACRARAEGWWIPGPTARKRRPTGISQQRHISMPDGTLKFFEQTGGSQTVSRGQMKPCHLLCATKLALGHCVAPIRQCKTSTGFEMEKEAMVIIRWL